jgi:transposase
MKTVALDLGRLSTDWCEVREQKIVARGVVSSVQELLCGALAPEHGRARVAYEACRSGRHVHDLLSAAGHEPVMLDTTRVREMGVGRHGRKNDTIDATTLAMALERGYVARAHVMSDAARSLRERLEIHRTLVSARASQTQHVRGIAAGRGIHLAASDTTYFAAMYRRAELPSELRTMLEPMLVMIELLDAQIASVDLSLLKFCEAQPNRLLERLASVPGVSLVTAAAFVSVIDDPARFRSASQVASYLGLCPSEDSSGGRDKRRLGAITKCGNPYLRHVLVEASWGILRSRDTTDPLVCWSRRIADRRGRMRAAVAVARRIARVLWAIWKHGAWYDPTGLLTRMHLEAAEQTAKTAKERDELASAIEKRALSEKKARAKIQALRRAHERVQGRKISRTEVS